ncbi:MAG: protein-L-isoaspartate O-methyltransferase, partial [Burkholderiales bacterium]|nr:protein-L-isoaspartate O-methyltransferase [Burkholderiales bacterium]
MTAKDKRFPLLLSSVVGQGKRSDDRSKPTIKTEMPQTAMRNAVKHAVSKPSVHPISARGLVQVPRAMPSPNPNTSNQASMPLVSANIRKAMVAKVAQQGVSDSLVLGALEAIPRHLFIESGLSGQ